MKKNQLKTVLFIGLLALGTTALGQGAPPPPIGGGAGGTHNQNGGGAPIGGGMGILLSLGVAYGSKKVYNIWKNHLEE